MGKFIHSLANKVLDILHTMEPTGRFIGIDGVDGSGKTSFAANLAAEFHHRPVIVIHADDFLNPSSIRHTKGRTSPEGFWEDTYNYDALREQVLTPLGLHENGWYSPASYNPATDQTASAAYLQAPSEALVVVEGMFLHRDELAAVWDASVFLDVPFTETAARMATRNGSNADPEHPTMRRYVHGQRLYFDAAHPWERATFVIDNSNFTSPTIIQPDMALAVLQGIPERAARRSIDGRLQE